MSILNINPDDITSQTHIYQQLYNNVEIRDGLGTHKGIVLDVDEKYEPSLVGIIARDGNNYEWPGLAVLKNNGDNHWKDILRQYYQAGWVLPDTQWFKDHFGNTYGDRWRTPLYRKFRKNVVPNNITFINNNSHNIHMWTSEEVYDQHISQPILFSFADFRVPYEVTDGFNVLEKQCAHILNTSAVDALQNHFIMLIKKVEKVDHNVEIIPIKRQLVKS